MKKQALVIGHLPFQSARGSVVIWTGANMMEFLFVIVRGFDLFIAVRASKINLFLCLNAR